MTQNIPVLYQNIMLGMHSNMERAAFFWAVKQPGEDRCCYRAEKFAHEVAFLAFILPVLLRAGAKRYSAQDVGDGSVPYGLMDFILTRHANWRFGGNVKPPYLKETP